MSKRQHSLSAKTVHSTVYSCILFGIVTLIIALVFYGYTLTKQYINLADGIARQTKMTVTDSADAITISEQTLNIYRSLNDEQRAKVGTEEYRSYFADVDTAGNGCAYDELIRILGGALGFHKEIYDIYLAMYDRDTSAMVYIVDSDESEEDRLMPGDWEAVDEKGMMHFLNGSESDTLFEIGHTELYGWLCTVGVPIQNADGETAVFMLVDVSLANLLQGMTAFAWRFSLTIILLTLLIAWRQSKKIKKRLVEPINTITDAAERFAEHSSEDAEYFNLDIHTDDELERLVRTMSDMEHSLKVYGAELLHITAEKERISTELSLATRIQESMLPHCFPPYPDRHEFDIFASMEPAREVGGDFYDFFLIDEDHLCVVMADVSGKGIPAALFMMISKTILQSCAMLGKSAAEILTKTNEALCSNNQTEMFVTVWLGILEISTGKLTCANAGHEYPVLKQKSGEFVLYKDKHSFAVGGMEGIRYKEYTILLEPGDMLFLYTDGLPEAENADQEMFTTERMIAALNTEPNANPEKLLSNVRESVRGFVRDAEQFDDLTMLCMTYHGDHHAADGESSSPSRSLICAQSES